jgi:thymidylate synthase (FAD)
MTAPTPRALAIDVLDHGYVRLVDSMGGDLSVVRAARVSHSADWRAGADTGSDAKLIRYLWAHKHTTPFEAVTLTFEIKAPIFVFRQWHRHRTQSYNEVSARYSVLPSEFYVPAVEQIGQQSTANKQGRQASFRDRAVELGRYTAACEAATALYADLLAADWPRELARMVLPVSVYSRMFTTMNLLNCFRFLTLRDDAHAQREIRVYAAAMLALLADVCPECVAAFQAGR